MSSGDGLMISGMGGTIPLIAMRGGNKQLGGVSGEQVSVDLSKNTVATSVDTSKNTVATSVDTSGNTADISGNSVTSVDTSGNTAATSVDTSGNSVTSIDPSGNSVTSIDPSGNSVDPSKITWEGTEYNISQTKEEWKEDDTENFLNFLGIPKEVFSSDEQEYIDFIEGIRTCLDDSSSIDTTCDAVNNILRRVIELRIQELVEQKRYGNVQKVMNVISHKEDGSNPVAEPIEEAKPTEQSS